MALFLFFVNLGHMSFTRILFAFLIFGVLTGIVLSGCRKETRIPLLTTSPSFINDDLFLVGSAILYSEGDAPITAKGFCWSETVKNPSLANENKIAGTGAGSFTLALTIIKPNASYYVRAYATNKNGTAYGKAEVLLSGAAASLADLRSLPPFKVSTNSVVVRAAVESDPTQIREVGFCWTTEGLPDLSSSHFTTTLSGGILSGSITGLSANSSYSVRPYAKTPAGVAYGELIPIKTFYGTMTDQAGNIYNTIQIGDQLWTAENFRSNIFRDGQFIPNLGDASYWAQNTSAACCSFNNLPATVRNGLYYNFAAVNDSRFTPLGWHVPTQLEFTALINALGGNQLAGDPVKTAEADQWGLSFTTNAPSGFNAMSTGYRTYYGTFVNTGTSAYFVSRSYLSNSQVFTMELTQTSAVSMQLWEGRSGFSVRLIKD